MLTVEVVRAIRDRVEAPTLPDWMKRLGDVGLPFEPSARGRTTTRGCNPDCNDTVIESCACYYGPGVCGDVWVDNICGSDCRDTCYITNCTC